MLKETVADWIKQDPDPNTQDALQKLLSENKTQQLEALFSGRLEFGTAGLRGAVGPGPMQMNSLVIRQTTAGIAHYLIECFPDNLNAGVILGYDGRCDSKKFAEEAACVLAAYGINSHLIHFECPTPFIPFGVVKLQCLAGIMITASHNPPEYNGLKFYWQHGGQIEQEHIERIQVHIEQQAQQECHIMPLDQALKTQRLVFLDQSFFQSYKQHLLLLPFRKHAKIPPNVTMAYTALHGVGTQITQALLHDLGLNHCHFVSEQCEPDGKFPTLENPNPEDKKSFSKVIQEAEKHQCLLAIAHDPDADRFSVAVQDEHQHYHILTGDQVGCLIADYLLEQPHHKQQLVGTTIVSSSMLEKIAKHYRANFYQTLTGFKWLSKYAMDHQTKKLQFLFAYEEALGYMFGHQIWDKDGICAMMVFLDLCASLEDKKQTLWQRLEQLYRQHGLHIHQQATLPIQGDLMQKLRECKNYDLPDHTLLNHEDLIHHDTMPGNVITFFYNEVRVIVRPSGTEPKVKCYYEWIQPIHDKIHYMSMMNVTKKKIRQFVEVHQAFLRSL